MSGKNQMETNNPHSNETARRLAEETGLADAAEATGVVLHELGNVLNNILLDTKLLQRKFPEEHRERLAETWRLITTISEQMQELNQFRHSRRGHPYPVNLHEVIQNCVNDLDDGEEIINLHLGHINPVVMATETDVFRVCRLLFKNAVSVSGKHGFPLVVRTEKETNFIHLIVEISGLGIKEQDLPHLFEPFASIVPEWNPLEMAICKNLLQRGQGQIQAKSTDLGFLQILLCWPNGS